MDAVFDLSNTSFEISEDFVNLFEACEAVGVILDYLHHFTDLAFVYDADKHIFIGVRIHSVDVDLCNAVVQFGQQFLRQLARRIGDDLELIAVFQSAQTVIYDDVCNKQVQQGTHYRCDLHAVHEKCDNDDACVHDKRNVCDVKSGLCPFQQCGNCVCTSARTEAAKHDGKSKAGYNACCDARKNYVEVILIVCEAVRADAECIIEAGHERLDEHIYAQYYTELFVYKNGDQNKYRQIESDHQNRPADIVAEQVIGDGGKTSDSAGGESVAVLKEMIGCSDNYSCDNSI